MIITDLRTENLTCPIGIDREKPVFSWKVQTEKSDWYQSSCRIIVNRISFGPDGKESPKRVWDSGEMHTSRMNGILYAGEKLEPLSRYEWSVAVTGEIRSPRQPEGSGKLLPVSCSEKTFFETAFFCEKEWEAAWIGEDQDETYHMFRKVFAADKEIFRARLYICGLGQEECYINGKKVSRDVLAPGWTDYRKSLLYLAYDVTDLLKKGENAVCVSLGDGMYRVPGGRYVYYPRNFGKRKLLAEIRIAFADGSEKVIGTDESWSVGPSPVIFSCIYGGEDRDGRIPGAQEASETGSFLGSDWTKAHQAERPKALLRSSLIPPVRVGKIYHPVSVTKTEKGYVFDLGKNFSGKPCLKIRTDGKAAGKKITLFPAELLRDGEPDQWITKNNCSFSYICSEKTEQEFIPEFTYTGFRYVRVSGAVLLNPSEKIPEGMPVIEEVRGEFLYPELEEAGSFSCSEPLFMQIHELIRQAMLSNTKSYFTDCPHREKLPWLEETHLIGPAMLCNWDLSGIYEKIEQDMEDSQRENGMVSDICPEYVTGFGQWNMGFEDSPEWGSACVLNPWMIYRKYGDDRLLRRFYPLMKKYTDYLTGRTHYGILHHGLGDWLDVGPCYPYSQNTPIPVTATAVYYMDLEVMAQTAELLGKTEDTEKYRKQMKYVKEEYNIQFLDDQTGRYATGSQAAQSMSLMAGLVPEEFLKKLKQQLRNEIVKRNYAITAGDVGHPFLVAAMTEYGMNDLLARMTAITDTPGYGYQLKCGATALTEDWDGPNPSHPQGSQNHLMLGSIDEWFFAGLGGIQSVRTVSSFDCIRIRPHIAENVDFCQVSEQHPYGKLEVFWKKEGNSARVKVTVPPNLTVRLESEDGETDNLVGSGTYEYMVTV